MDIKVKEICESLKEKYKCLIGIFLSYFRYTKTESGKYTEFIYSSTLWSGLRTIGNSSAIKSTIFIPVLGYAILFNANFVEYIELSPTYTSNSYFLSLYVEPEHVAKLETSYKLYFIYFGLCFMALGSILYISLCPSAIKKYKNGGEYYRNEHEVLSFHEKKVKIKRLIQNDKKYSLEKININDAEFHNNFMNNLVLNHFDKNEDEIFAFIDQEIIPQITEHKEYKIELNNELNNYIRDLKNGLKEYKDEGDAHIFKKEFENGDVKLFLIRHIIFLLYILGFLLLAIPAIDTFLSISVTFFDKFSFLFSFIY